MVERLYLAIEQQMMVLIVEKKLERMEARQTGVEEAVGGLEFLLQLHLSLEPWVQGKVQHG
jgi:hypothetical protein